MNNQEFITQYNRLPEVIKEALHSKQTVDVLDATIKKHALHIDDLMILSDIVGQVMLGNLRSAQLAEEIKNRLKVSHTLATAIVNDLNRDLFHPIRQELREVQEGNEESRDDILNSIENPVQTPSVSRQHTPGEPAPQEVVVPAEAPVIPTPPRPVAKTEEEKPKPSILERKKKEPFTAGTDDVASRINRDPYKESIG